MEERMCLVCGESTKSPLQWRVYCDDCRGLVTAVQVIASRTMKLYNIPGPREYACVDCGLPAQAYDHRYYSHPLEVDPVCLSCNNKRGPALDIVECVRELAAYGIITKYGKPSFSKRILTMIPEVTQPVISTLKIDIKQIERERIGVALAKTKGNKSAAAKILGMKRTTLLSKISTLN